MPRLLILLLAVSLAGSAQTSTGNIGGSVEDSSGARVPNAKVTITHVGTQQTRVVNTNERGEYLAPLMPIGEYVVSGEMEGFKRKSLSGILLRVDQTLTVPIVIEPGSVREIVEVVSSAPLLDAETSSLGQVIDNKRVLDLPLNGRNVFALGLLAGNTVEVFGMGTNQTFAAGGGRFSGNEIMLDGITNNTIMNRGSVGRNSVLYTPSVDALEEFKVKTNNFSAEFGHAAGAVVSATIKSGSNAPHGALWEFLRNDKLDANNFFSNAAARPKAPFHQNQFGGALGGPIVIPKLYDGHDRTFFFIDYEGTRRRTAASSSISDLAPMAFREGDFSSLPQRIYDPMARRVGATGAVISDPLPNNRIPASLISRTTAAVQSQIPVPNFGAPNARTRNFIRPQIGQRQNVDQFDVRIDHKISGANNIFGRFSFGNLVDPRISTFPPPLGAGGTQVQFSRHAVLNDVHVFSPTAINEFRFGYTRSNGSNIGKGQENAPFGQQIGLALFPFPVLGFPSFTFRAPGRSAGRSCTAGSAGDRAT